MVGAQAGLRRADAPAETWYPLLPSFRIGRAQHCHLVLSESHVSSEQATLRHTGDGEWIIRDLGSKNGTFVNHRRVASGDIKVADGDILGFGDEHVSWIFSSGRPSDVILVAAGRTDWIAIPRGERIVALPSGQQPEATVFYRGKQWYLETLGADPVTLSDGQSFVLSDLRYRVWLSNESDPTEDAAASRRRVIDAVLKLSVSSDEEEVRGEVCVGAARLPLPGRVYLYMLVLLGRYHEEDSRSGLSVGEAGWRYADDVSRSLGLDQQALNVQVYRARQDLAKLGFEDPAALIERRALTKQMRLGIRPDRVLVTKL
jgi:hypothetical protein